MLKKIVIVAVVVISVFSISVSAFADTFENNPYGSNGSGIGLNNIGGVQYIRGQISNGESSMSTTEFYDYTVLNSTPIYGEIEGTGSNSSSTTWDYRLSVDIRTTEHNRRRAYFPATYIPSSGAYPQVVFQYIIGRGTGTSAPASKFSVGQRGWISFHLYFSDVSSVSSLSFSIQAHSTWYKFLDESGYRPLLTDLRTLRGIPNTITKRNDSVLDVSFNNVDEPISNYLSFRIPYEVVRTISPWIIHTDGPSFYYDIVSFNINSLKFSVDEKSAIQNSANNSVDEGQSSASTTQADSANSSISGLVSSMGYSGTNAVLNIPAFTWGLGNIIPERKWFDGVNIDMGAYINQFVPANILTLIRALCDIAVVFFCVKELYNLMSTVLVNRKASED